MTKLEYMIPDLRNLSITLGRLAEKAPERLTLSQAYFFLEAALCDLTGKPTTFTELRDRLGPVMSRSLHTTYKVFLGEEGRDSKRQQALGWLERETDRNDNRRKYFRLTKRGRQVLADIAVGDALMKEPT